MRRPSPFAPLSALLLASSSCLLGACALHGANDDAAVTESAQTTTHDAGAEAEDPDEGVGQPSCGADCAPASLPSCDATPSISGPIATPTPFGTYVTYDPGPIAPVEDRSFVFLDASMWMDVHQGTVLTQARPAPIASARAPRAFTSLSGPTVIVYDEPSGATSAATFDGASFGTSMKTPCASADVLNGACDARAAGDGHLWIRKGGNLYEQVGTDLELRGGPPVSPGVWDVDAAGNVFVIGTSTGPETLVVWKLAPGAGGWIKTGALPKSLVDGTEIEGGFRLDANFAKLAPDGSIHVFSDARCIGTGDRNKAQVHLRSRDGASWSIERLPSADTLYDGQVSWRHAAIWAEDYDRVRTVVLSSPKPSFDGFAYSYPDRQYNLLRRCRTAEGRASFARAAFARVPRWTERAFAAFSSTGTATFLTRSGITQVY